MYTRFPAPADDKDHGNTIDCLMKQRGNRIDDISFARILHVDNGHPPCCQIVTGSKCGAVAFIGCDHMVFWINAVFPH